MPVRNGAKYISEAIQSVKLQSYDDWELIIINDNSTDNTAEIIRELRDNRIQLIENKGNGIIEALHNGLQYSTGKYVTRFDSDDIMPADRIEKMLSFCIENTVVTGLVEYFPENQVSEGYKNYQTWLNQINLQNKAWENIYRECVIASPNWMMLMKDLDRIGGFRSLEYPEDYDLVFQWYKNRFKIEVIPEVTLNWREHPLRTSKTSKNYQQESFFNLKIKRFLELDHNGKSLLLWGKGVKSRLVKDILKSENIEFIYLQKNEFRETELHPSSQLLICVYPDANEREKMDLYLNSINFKLGKNYWYL